MDGPNVNWALFNCLQDKMYSDHDKGFIDIGSCGLHILHNCFRHGADATGWDISTILTSLHKLFKDVPAHREDFETITKSCQFPLKFCAHRWIENINVANRAREIRNNIEVNVNAVNNKQVRNPQTKLFDVMKEWVSDPLAVSKLSFFVYVATSIESFLRNYQSDVPQLSHLSDDLTRIVSTLMEIIVKQQLLTPIKNDPYKLMKIDLSDGDNMSSCKNIDLGFATSSALKESRAYDRDRYQLRQECKQFVLELLKN